MSNAPPTSAAAHVIDWLVGAALGPITAEEAFGGLVDRLRAEGIAIDRAHLSHTTLHPLHRSVGLLWTAEAGWSRLAWPPAVPDDSFDGWLKSPIKFAIDNDLPLVRRRLTGPRAMIDFPVLEELAVDGFADYCLLLQNFDNFMHRLYDDEPGLGPQQPGMAVSFATRRDYGFHDSEIATIEWLLRPLAVIIKMCDQSQIARNLARCYIGHQAGPRVLGGEISRGDIASTRAVVWLSDLRGSTEMAASLPRHEFIALLNRFFDSTVGAVEEEGGEPLAFLGDGALAIFPIESFGEAGARAAAMAAARRAAEAMDAVNAERFEAGAAALGWGLALHAGELDYGNIGVPARHAWSVIGPVVNEAARLESLCKLLGEPLLASAAFADGDAGGWRDLGLHELRGVATPFQVFAPRDDRMLRKAP